MKTIITVFICNLALISPLPSSFFPHEYVPNSKENIALINSGNYVQNIESLGGQFEGDMILTDEQKWTILGLDRNGLIAAEARWPNKTVVYRYADGHFNKTHIEAIESALRRIESVSCVKFKRRTSQKNYVEITGFRTGCHSQVGFLRRGVQNLNLQKFNAGYGCFNSGTIIHEFFHTLGFYHMQSSSERDNYVKINWRNIKPGNEHNFMKWSERVVTNYGIDYDLESVMHYNAYAFTKNGLPTIIPYDITLIDVMGKKMVMSDKDIQRLNAMYKCYK